MKVKIIIFSASSYPRGSRLAAEQSIRNHRFTTHELGVVSSNLSTLLSLDPNFIYQKKKKKKRK